MKLLVCVSEYYPHGSGIANVACNVVTELRKSGVDCSVCSPGGPDIALGSYKLIQKTGIIGLLYFWYQVSRFFKNNTYDAVWLHNPYFFFSNPFHSGLATIHTTYHGASINLGGSSLYLRLYKKVVSMIERRCLLRLPPPIVFSGVGQPVCNELAEIGIEKKRIRYIPNGVDITRYQPRENKKSLRKTLGIPIDDIVLLSVGRLTPQKQPHRMIEVFSVLEKQRDRITLCIVGKGELLKSAQDLVKMLGVQKILFLNYVDDKDLPLVYACSDYYILTSSYEGTPLTLLEAMATGLPCIVSDIPNLRIVQDAHCGIIVSFDDIPQAADEILKYLQSEHPDHADNARRFSLENLDWNHIAELYAKKFSEISDIPSKNQIAPDLQMSGR